MDKRRGGGSPELEARVFGYVGMRACLFGQACAHSCESVHLVQWCELH